MALSPSRLSPQPRGRNRDFSVSKSPPFCPKPRSPRPRQRGLFGGRWPCPDPVFPAGPALPCPGVVPHSWVSLPHLSRVCSAAPPAPGIGSAGAGLVPQGRVCPGKNELGKARWYLGEERGEK